MRSVEPSLGLQSGIMEIICNLESGKTSSVCFAGHVGQTHRAYSPGAWVHAMLFALGGERSARAAENLGAGAAAGFGCGGYGGYSLGLSCCESASHIPLDPSIDVMWHVCMAQLLQDCNQSVLDSLRTVLGKVTESYP